MGLNPIEKLWLIIHGRRDGKRELFQACDLSEYNPEIKTRRKVYLSSFIMTELSGFNERVISCFGRIICKPRGTFRIMKAQKALEWCDSKINEIEAEINSTISALSVEMKNIDELISVDGAHFGVLKAQKKADLLNKCNNAEKTLLKKRVDILGEKNKIITRMIIKLNVLSSKSYLRSSYYYGQARIKDRRITTLFMSEKEYVALCDSSVLNECKEAETKIATDLDATQKRIKKQCNMQTQNQTQTQSQTQSQT